MIILVRQFFIIASIFFILIIPTWTFGQEVDVSTVTTEQEFEWGVRAYNNGFYNESALSFLRILARFPQSRLARIWLARSYYASGAWDAAEIQYRILVSNNEISPYIYSKIDALDKIKNDPLLLKTHPQYVVAQEINGRTENGDFFLRPTGVAVDSNLNLYVASFASHEVLRLSVDGDIHTAIWKPRYRFDRPYSVLLNGDKILVSEFGQDRVIRFDENNTQEIRFNRAGRYGKFAGPQYLATDTENNIYVSDWGNRRIVKLNSNGNFIFQFSRFNIPLRPSFSPTGIVYHDPFLYIVNSANRTIVVIDQSGNYIRSIALPSGVDAEGLAVFNERQLLLATNNGIFIYDLHDALFTQIASAAGDQIISLAIDQNNIIYATDFEKNRILVFSPVDEVYSGLNVHVLSVDNSRFPSIEMDVAVQNRFGEPIVGLGRSNFFVREGPTPYQIELANEQIPSERAVSVMIIIPATKRIDAVSQQMQMFITELLDTFDEKDQVGVVLSGAQTVLRFELGTPFVQIRSALNGLLQDANNAPVVDKDTSFAASMRVAVSELILGATSRSIVYMTDNESAISMMPFDQMQITQLLSANAISLIELSFSNDNVGNNLEEFYQQTNTSQFEYADDDVIGEIVRTLHAHDGRYRLRYTSESEVSGNFGRQYIPVSVIASLYQRSASDEMGYYPAVNN